MYPTLGEFDELAAEVVALEKANESGGKVFDLLVMAGGTSVYRRPPLQRRFRDIHVATQHMVVNPATYETAGRLLLGLPTNTDRF